MDKNMEFYFNDYEAIDVFYNRIYEDSQKLYSIYETEKSNTFIADMFNFLCSTANSITKEGKYIEKLYSKVLIQNTIHTTIEKYITFIDFGTEFDDLYLETYDDTIGKLKALNNITVTIIDIVRSNKNSLSKEKALELHTIGILIDQVYSNIATELKEKITQLNQYVNGIIYYSKYEININTQFQYIFNKLKEIGYIDDVRNFIIDNFGEDYFILKMIP